MFHLLSGVDLDALGHSNLHYSADIVNSLASEPIPDNRFFWSGRGLSIVTCARILPFSSVVAESRQEVPRAASEPDKSVRVVREAPLDAGEGPADGPANRRPGALADLGEIVDSVIRTERAVPIHPVHKRKLLWADAAEDDYPPADQLLVVTAYNLRFQVTDRIEAGLASQNADAATRESLLESFGDRRVVREHLLQQALKERQWCPDRPIAKARHPQKGRDMEYYVLLRSRLTDVKRIKDGPGLEIEILP